MVVNGVSGGQTAQKAGVVDTTALTQQKAALEEEVRQTTANDKLQPDAKAKQLAQLEKQIEAIEAQIKSASKSGGVATQAVASAQPKNEAATVAARPRRVDTHDRKEDQLPSSPTGIYSLEKDEDGTFKIVTEDSKAAKKQTQNAAAAE